MGAILENPDINNLIFLHIPKCAGTTFLFILNNQYDNLNHFDIGQLASNESNIDNLINKSKEEREKINLIKGHQDFGLHKYLIGPTAYITFVRHPVQRITSFYHFAKKNPDNRLYQYIHKYNFSLKDFVLKFNDFDINNGQINRLGGLPFEDENTQLTKALKNIETYFPIVGIVEKYDESLMLMKNYYGWTWPYYVVVNKNKKKPKTIISPEIENLIIEKNQGDYKLYLEMNKRLDAQIYNSTDYIEKQVKRFKSLNQLFIHQKMMALHNKIKKLF